MPDRDELQKQVLELERKVQDLQILVRDMSRWCPDIEGKCPKCGHYVFDGYVCSCGVDYSLEENRDKLIRRW